MNDLSLEVPKRLLSVGVGGHDRGTRWDDGVIICGEFIVKVGGMRWGGFGQILMKCVTMGFVFWWGTRCS